MQKNQTGFAQTADIFISYARSDIATAKGIDVALDVTHLMPGDDYAKRLDDLLIASAKVVFLASSASLASSACAYELELAAKHTKPIFPLLLEDIEKSDLPPALQEIQYLRLDKPDVISQLITAIRMDLQWERKHAQYEKLAIQGKTSTIVQRAAVQAAQDWLEARPQHATQVSQNVLDLINRSRRALKRRAQMLFAGLSVVTLILTILTIGFFLQREEALTQSAAAQKQALLAEKNAATAARNYETAKTAIDALVIDIAKGLQGVEGVRVETIRHILNRAEIVFDRLIETNPTDSSLLVSRSEMLLRFASINVTSGDTDAAEKRIEDVLTLSEGQIAREPEAKIWMYQKAKGLIAHGAIFARQGDMVNALAIHEEALEIGRKLEAMTPDDPAIYESFIAPALLFIGHHYLQQSDTKSAKAVIEDLIMVGQMLIEQESSVQSGNMLLADGFFQMAEVHKRQGDISEAATALQNAMKIAREKISADPFDLNAHAMIARILDYLGSLKATNGDFSGAFIHFNEALQVARKISMMDPDNLEWQMQSAIALERVGAVQADPKEARGAFSEAGEIYNKIASSRADNLTKRTILTESRHRSGNLLLQQGLLVDAEIAFSDAINGYDNLLQVYPKNIAWQVKRSDVLTQIGILRIHQEDPANAVRSFEEAIKVYRNLTKIDSENLEWQEKLSNGLLNIGLIQEKLGNLTAAKQAVSESELTLRRLIAKTNENIRFQKMWMATLDSLGILKMRSGDLKGASADFEELLDIARDMLDKDPDNAEFQRTMLGGLERKSALHQQQGDVSKAVTALEEMIDIQNRIFQANPQDTELKRVISLISNRINILRSQM